MEPIDVELGVTVMRWVGISHFFTSLAEGVEFRTFEPKSFASGSDTVAARLRLTYQVRATRRVVDENQVHWWALRGGKVCGLVHFEDTAQVIAAIKS